MDRQLKESYAECCRVARASGSNFFFSFLVLPRAKRMAMCALYAFLRHTDDLGDSEQPLETRRAALSGWRSQFHQALAGQYQSPLLPALVDTMTRYQIPVPCLLATLDGVERDLEERPFETFDELAVYCSQVAGAVGRACIQIWGHAGPGAHEPARSCGLALQLTNILRDLGEDAQRGRVYLPLEDLRRFSYPPEDLRQGVRDARFQALIEFEIARIDQFHREAAELPRWLSADGQPAFGAIVGVYRELLEEIKRRNGDVFTERIRLSRWRKLRIVSHSLWTNTRWPWKRDKGSPATLGAERR